MSDQWTVVTPGGCEVGTRATYAEALELALQSDTTYVLPQRPDRSTEDRQED